MTAMKKIFILLAAACFAVQIHAQVDRSKAPAAAPAPKIQLGQSQTFELKNGLKVILVENHKVPMVTYNLFLDINPATEGNKAGLSQLTGDLLRSGTSSRTKDQIDEEIDFIGASLNPSATGMMGRSLKKHSNTLLSIMSDLVMNASFPEEELAKLKKQTLTGINANKEEPEAIAENVSSRLLYGNQHPYGEIMSEQSVEAITGADCKNYYQSYFRPNTAYLIVVGDINLKEAKKIVNLYFGKWQRGVVPSAEYPKVNLPQKAAVMVANKDGANQSAIRVTHIVDLKPGAPDAIAASVMNNVLGGGSFSARLFANLREDKAWTYGAYSAFNPDKHIGHFSAEAKVKGQATDSALIETLKEMERLKTEPVSESDLALFKNMMAGSFARSLEDPATVARFALNIKRFNLPETYYSTYLEKLAAVTPADVQAMANRYLKPENAYLIAVGDVSKIKAPLGKILPNQKITTYDFYGNEVKIKSIPAGMTAANVIAQYLRAIGGTQKLEQVKSVSTITLASIQGMKIEVKSCIQSPDRLCIETYLQGNVMSKQILNGNRGKVTSPMGEQMLNEEMVAMMRDELQIFPELAYTSDAYTLELLAVEEIGGESAYKVSIASPAGNQTIAYFATESGLKLKEIKTTPQGQATSLIKAYKEVNGIQFPSVVTQQMGPQIFDMEVTEIQINPAIPAEQFNI